MPFSIIRSYRWGNRRTGWSYGFGLLSIYIVGLGINVMVKPTDYRAHVRRVMRDSGCSAAFAAFPMPARILK